MLTNNFINISKVAMLSQEPSAPSANIPIKDTRGVIQYLTLASSGPYTYPFSHSDIGRFSSSYPNQGWVLGTDNTSATVNDYSMTAIQPSKFTGTVTNTFISEDDKYIRRITLLVTNNGTENLVIGEIGFIGSAGTKTAYPSNGSSSTSSALLYREAFETPITLAPTESVSFIVDLYAEI